MGYVTNLIIATVSGEPGMGQVNSGYNPTDFVFSVVSADDPGLPHGWYGGTKMLKCDLWIGAINHLDLNDLIGFMKLVNWQCPEAVQIIVKHQNDERFRIIDLFPPAF